MTYGRSEEIKQKLRQLKRFEERLRSDGNARPARWLVWDSFFSTHDTPPGRVKYPLATLAAMGKEAYKAVIDAYLAFVYYELFQDKGAELPQGNYDPEILARLGLPKDAGLQEIKRQFRALAKKYHPDTGGDAASFIELMDTYRRLIDK
jgi:DnaJ-domain-containing protein 1